MCQCVVDATEKAWCGTRRAGVVPEGTSNIQSRLQLQALGSLYTVQSSPTNLTSYWNLVIQVIHAGHTGYTTEPVALTDMKH